MTEEKLPHERRDDETPSAYEAFLIYLENDPRSLRIVAEELARRKHGENSKQFQRIIKRKKPTSEVEKWSVKYDWVNRVALYAEYLFKQATKERLARINKAREHNYKIAQLVKKQGVKALSELGKLLDILIDPEKGDAKDQASKVPFNPNQIISLIKEGVSLERQALSLPNYEEVELRKAIKDLEEGNNEDNDLLDVGGLSEDELDEYDSLLSRLEELNNKAKKVND